MKRQSCRFRRSATSLALGAILLAALGLRAWHIGRPSIWWDELFALTASAGHIEDWYAMPRNTVIDPAPDLASLHAAAGWSATWHTPDIHPPLYAAMLRLWRSTTGDSDVAARWLSVIASLAAIVLVFDVGRTLLGDGPALWAAGLMAVSEWQIIYGQEATSYAVLSALGMGAFAAAARLAKNGFSWPRTSALVLSAIAMLFIHYFAVGPIFALGVWGLSRLRGRALAWTVSSILVFAAIGFVLTEPRIVTQIHWIRQNASWLSDDTPGRLGRLFSRLKQLPMNLICEQPLRTASYSAFGAILYVLPFALIRRQPGMLPCALWLWGAVGVVALSDLLTHSGALDYPRFSLIAAPAVFLILAGLPTASAWIRHGVPAAVMLGCLMSLHEGQAYDFALWKGEWRTLGSDVAAHAKSGDMIVFASHETGFLVNPMQVYGYVTFYVQPVPCPVVLLNAPSDPLLLARLKAVKGHVWVVTPRNDSPQSLLPTARIKPTEPPHRLAGELYEATWPDSL
jgi:hypothetical protein